MWKDVEKKDIRHDPFERARLAPRVPFDACEAVIGPEVEEEEDDELCKR